MKKETIFLHLTNLQHTAHGYPPCVWTGLRESFSSLKPEGDMACPKPGTAKVCAPCEQGEASGLKVYTAEELQKELSSLPLWTASAEGDFIIRSFVAKNFVSAMAFLNSVATVAEEQGHHPDLHLTQYRNVEIRLQTHSMGGVTQNDVMEARLFDQLPVTYSPKWLREHPAASAETAPITQATSSSSLPPS